MYAIKLILGVSQFLNTKKIRPKHFVSFMVLIIVLVRLINLLIPPDIPLSGTSLLFAGIKPASIGTVTAL
jgi:hypothetical protein